MKRGLTLSTLLMATIASSIVTFYLGSHCGFQMGTPPSISLWRIDPHGPDPTNLGPRLYAAPNPFHYTHWYTVSAFVSLLLGLLSGTVAQYFIRNAVLARLCKRGPDARRHSPDLLLQARRWYH